MLRHARERGIDVDWTFYCMLGQPGTMDEKAQALGARVIHSPVPIVKKMDFIRALRNQLRRGGYDVLHCHHDIVSAVYLLAASGMSIRRRIVHVHNADEVVPTPSLFKQRFYREPMRRFCLFMADRIVGISNHTLDKFLAGQHASPERDPVHYYGVDPMPFENVTADRAGFRRQLDLSRGCAILLFGGRLVPEKNPVFARGRARQFALYRAAGCRRFRWGGSQRWKCWRGARELGVENSVRLLGWQDDLPEIMICSDWFILPHPEHPVEGFGLAIVEAQLAGLRMLLSRGIPDDPLLSTASFRRLALAEGPKAMGECRRWNFCIVRCRHVPPPSLRSGNRQWTWTGRSTGCC